MDTNYPWIIIIGKTIVVSEVRNHNMRQMPTTSGHMITYSEEKLNYANTDVADSKGYANCKLRSADCP